MSNIDNLREMKELSFLVVRDEKVEEISESFLRMTMYSVEDFVNKNIIEIFKILRFGPSFSFDKLNEDDEYFLFNKELEVIFVNVKLQDHINKRIYTFIEKPNSDFDTKFPLASILCKDNHYGIGIFSLPDITLLKANEKFISFLDAPNNCKENCIGKFVGEFVTGLKGSPSEGIWQTIMKTGETINIDEYQFDGLERGITYWKCSYTPIYEKGKLKYCIQMATEITEQVLYRKKIEVQSRIIEDQNTKLQALLDNTQEGIFVVDREGKYIIKNKVAREQFLYSAQQVEEVIAAFKVYDINGNIVPINELPENQVKAGKIVENKIYTCVFENYERYVIVSGIPIFDNSGEFLYGIISSRDISEFIKSERALREIQAQLLQSEKEKSQALQEAIEMKDEFLSIISHEFRTPLNVINTAVQAIIYLCGDELSDKAKDYIKIIKQNMYRQLRLVNNLLDINRANAGHIKVYKKNIDIVFLTKAITESVRSYALQKELELKFTSSLDSKIIAIDDEKYERILLNLLSNSIKFTQEGREVTVKICTIKNFISVEVKDKGIGIPKEKRDIIFERFGQVDSSLSRQAEGAGIGLSLVKKLIEAMGGSISVKSRVGFGSAFTILLPDIMVQEDNTDYQGNELLNNRLIQIANVEFSDIYM
jgi:PAS domain S-box-containing protein